MENTQSNYIENETIDLFADKIDLKYSVSNLIGKLSISGTIGAVHGLLTYVGIQAEDSISLVGLFAGITAYSAFEFGRSAMSIKYHNHNVNLDISNKIVSINNKRENLASEYEKIESVEISQTLFDRITNTGNIKINLKQYSDRESNVRLYNVENPKVLEEKIMSYNV